MTTSINTSLKTAPLRTVFDSNIYIAAALRPGQYADRWLDIATLPSSGVELYVSPYILNEVGNKLVDRFGFRRVDVKQFIERVKISATLVKPDVEVKASKDPDDNNILACAISARAQLIITADSGLLKLSPYRGIGIAEPRELKRIFASDYRNPN